MNGSPEMPEDKTARAVLIAEAENRLQFNVFVSIFFCTLVYSFFRSINKDDVAANTALRNWAAVPTYYLLNYVLFVYGRSVIPEWWLEVIDVLLLIGSAFFILPMSIIAAAQAKWSHMELLVGAFSLKASLSSRC
jgi:hypothetical protein